MMVLKVNTAPHTAAAPFSFFLLRRNRFRISDDDVIAITISSADKNRKLAMSIIISSKFFLSLGERNENANKRSNPGGYKANSKKKKEKLSCPRCWYTHEDWRTAICGRQRVQNKHVIIK